MSDPALHPIATVPRDGRLVTIGAEGCGWFLMRWNPRRTNPFVGAVVGMWECPHDTFTWTEDDGAGPQWWMPYEPGPHRHEGNGTVN